MPHALPRLQITHPHNKEIDTLTVPNQFCFNSHKNTIYSRSHCLPTAVGLHHGCQHVLYVTLRYFMQAGPGQCNSRGLASLRRAADTGWDKTQADYMQWVQWMVMCGGTGSEACHIICFLQDSALSVQVTVFGKRQGAGGGRHQLLVYSELRDQSSTQPFERHCRIQRAREKRKINSH